jgi:exodeoxyribonuclease V alpha subunit
MEIPVLEPSTTSLTSEHPVATPVVGRVCRILYPTKATHSERDDFHIFVLKDGQSEVVVHGKVRSLHQGMALACVGTWTTHEKYGRYFKAGSITEDLPQTADDMLTYLKGARLPGLGPKTAQKLVDTFGTELFTVLDKRPERLLEISSLTHSLIERIQHAWDERRSGHIVRHFLEPFAISPALARTVHAELGGEGISGRAIVAKFERNPYLLAPIRGIGFETADRIARSLGIANANADRLRAAVHHLLLADVDRGSTLTSWTLLTKRAAALLGLPHHDVASALPALCQQDAYVSLRSYDNDACIGLTWLQRSEERVAIELHRINTLARPIASPEHPLPAIPEEPGPTPFVLDESQRRAVEAACRAGVSVLTGRPGTGKTATLRSVIRIALTAKKRIVCCAPTGLAAMRLSEATGLEATTIHRLLGADKRDFPAPLNADIVIVDEMSMVGVVLMARLLERIPSGSTLILVGDVDQLQSVEAGHVLSDVIAANCFTVSRLTTIHRQQNDGSKGSGIVTAAHAIIEGRVPTGNDSDFRIINQTDSEIAALWIVEVVKRMQSRGTPYDNIQVLSPIYKGPLGVHALNTLLQTHLNAASPDKREVRIGDRLLREGDRVIQTRNDYDAGVFNGEVGYLTRIAPKGQHVTVRLAGHRFVTLERAKMGDLSLAYCTTVHKFEGSELDNIIIPVDFSHSALLNKNVLYTAVTRARKQCVLIGSPDAIKLATRTSHNENRRTALAHLLRASDRAPGRAPGGAIPPVDP